MPALHIIQKIIFLFFFSFLFNPVPCYLSSSWIPCFLTSECLQCQLMNCGIVRRIENSLIEGRYFSAGSRQMMNLPHWTEIYAMGYHDHLLIYSSIVQHWSPGGDSNLIFGHAYLGPKFTWYLMRRCIVPYITQELNYDARFKYEDVYKAIILKCCTFIE